MDDTFDFEIFVWMNGKTYRMEVYKIYHGDALERFKVKGGNRHIVLQSNRPFLELTKSRQAIDWKLLEGDFEHASPQTAAEALNKIIVEIELEIKK